MNNPLIVPILNFLKQQSAAVSEHELLSQLERQGDFSGGLTKQQAFSPARDLALFQKHFLIMNALYHLQDELLQDQWYLSISPLNIHLQPLVNSQASTLAEESESPALKAYYSDLSNLTDTDEQAVADLLQLFWQRYLAEDKRAEAYQALGLSVDASWQDIKQAYRRLAKHHHPDQGGDQQRFIEVRAAYEVLRDSVSS